MILVPSFLPECHTGTNGGAQRNRFVIAIIWEVLEPVGGRIVLTVVMELSAISAKHWLQTPALLGSQIANLSLDTMQVRFHGLPATRNYNLLPDHNHPASFFTSTRGPCASTDTCSAGIDFRQSRTIFFSRSTTSGFCMARLVASAMSLARL